MNAATILIVDDEPQIRRVMLTTLTSHGYTVVEAASGEEALEKLRSERPDLIILDVNMPGISGIETCAEIRTSSDVPIIMLTIRNSERDKVQALDAGADDFVVKPFGVQELMARIRAALANEEQLERVGAGLRRRNRVPACIHQSTEKKDRAGSAQASLHPHRALGRV